MGKKIEEQKIINTKFDIVLTSDWIHDLINGINYIHDKKIIHRDIKPGYLFNTLD